MSVLKANTKIYRELVATQEELGIANQTLEQHRRFLNQLRAWTLATDDITPPPHCGDVYHDGVIETKLKVGRMLRDLERKES